MELISFFVYFWFLPANVNLNDISFSENIEYCTSIMFDPSREYEFYNNCNSDEVDMYISLVKNNFKIKNTD